MLRVGIDIGGTKIATAVADESGELRARSRVPTHATRDVVADVARIAAEVRRLVGEAGGRLDDVVAVGVSAPGPLDIEAGRVLRPPNLPEWVDVPIRDLLARELGRPIHLDNDANAAALAEWRFGAGRGFDHLVYLTMSTGVGAGLVLSGRVHRGVACLAGEVGHMPIEWEGELCACGMRGCLEAYVGGAAWARRLRRVAPAGSLVVELAGGAEKARPEHVVEAARRGDAFACAEMTRFNDYLARAIVQLVFVLAPQVFVLGTIAVAAGEALCFAPVRERVRAHAWRELTEALVIAPAALGEHTADFAGLAVAYAGEGPAERGASG